jgi:LysM repeat protein
MSPIPTYTFIPQQGKIQRVQVLADDGAAKIESGNAKWTIVDRPMRRGATQYDGTDPYRISVPVLFDCWADGHGLWSGASDMETDMAALELMRREVSGGRPPQLKVLGALPPTGITLWVIDGIDWGDNVIRDLVRGKNLRLRQDAVVHLLEYVDTTVLKITSKLPGNSRGTQSERPKHSRHTVKKGETLAKIAVNEYGDRSKWRNIAKANGIRDPNHLKTGQVLTLP